MGDKKVTLQRYCPKCPSGTGIMDGEDMRIPKRVPIPVPLKPTVSLEPYLPKIIQQYENYSVYVCRTCGYVECFVHK